MAIEISINATFHRHSDSEASNWRREIYLKPGDSPRVDLEEMYGNGVPMPAWNHRWLHLGTLPSNVADASTVSDYLESDEAQAILQGYLDDYSEEWDGHNHVGSWKTEEAECAEESWSGLARVIEDCPTFWDASDWFCSWPDDLTAETTDAELEAMAPREVTQGSADSAYLDESDVLKALTHERDYRREKQGLPDGITEESAYYALDGPIEQRIRDLKYIISRLEGWVTNEAEALRGEAAENLSELGS